MNINRLVSVLIVASLSLAAPVYAVRNYSCNFETQAERDRWVLNPAANSSVLSKLKNKWYIGAPGNNDRNGQYGLFISDDNGQSAHYTNTAGCWVYAYDTISLEAMNGDYTVYFDYCVMANMASKFDGLYMLWIPESVKIMSIPSSPGKAEDLPEECLQ